MNIINSEEPYDVVAKTCGCKNQNRKIIYSFVDAYHGLSKDKKDIIMSEIEAFEGLRTYTLDEADRDVIEIEIAELKMTLDLLP
jgi:hypothetical protein